MHEHSNALVAHLEELEKNNDRGALASLRKGLGKAPGSVPEMFKHVVPYVRREASKTEEDACFLVASLFASYPDGSGRGDMGTTFRQICSVTEGESTEGRFVALLKCHRDELPNQLRHAVALARSRSATVDWVQLLYDVQDWNDTLGSVQRRWAKSFWGESGSSQPITEKEE